MSWIEDVVDTVMGAVVRTEDDLPKRTQWIVTGVIVTIGLAVMVGLAIHHGT